MTRLAAAVLLAVPAAARADMGLPWPLQRSVPVRVVVHLDDPPPGVALFAETRPIAGGLRRLPPGLPLVVESDRPGGGAHFTIYSVPLAALGPDGAIPARDRLRAENPQMTRVGGGGARGRPDFSDGRSEIVLEYRLVRHGDYLTVVMLSENAGSRWFGVGCCITGLAAPVGVAWTGLWVVRRCGRLFRRGG